MNTTVLRIDTKDPKHQFISNKNIGDRLPDRENNFQEFIILGEHISKSLEL